MAETKKLKVLIFDTLTLDNYIPVHPVVEDQPLTLPQVMFQSLKRGTLWETSDKGTLTPNDYKMHNDLLTHGFYNNGEKVKQGVGGSWFNTFTNVSNAVAHLGHEMEADIFTTVSHRLSGSVIRAGVSNQGNINIIPTLSEENQKHVESGASFNFMEEQEKGPLKKKIAAGKGKGNEEFLTPEMVREAYKNSAPDIICITGNAVEKFGKAVADTILEEAIKSGKPIFAAYPTKDTPAAREFFARLLPHATFTAPNLEEAAIFHETTKTVDTPKGPKEVPDFEKTMAALRESINQRAHLDPIMTVTDGPDGAYGFMPFKEPVHAPVWNKDTKLKEMTGAGDSFAAGVIAMIIAGYDTYKTLKAALMGGARFSDEVVQQIGTTMPKDRAPEVIQEVISRDHEWISDRRNAAPALLEKISRNRDTEVALPS